MLMEKKKCIHKNLSFLSEHSLGSLSSPVPQGHSHIFFYLKNILKERAVLELSQETRKVQSLFTDYLYAKTEQISIREDLDGIPAERKCWVRWSQVSFKFMTFKFYDANHKPIYT